jgi:hypothetical protein
MNWRLMLLSIFTPILMIGSLVFAYFEKYPASEAQEVAASRKTSSGLDLKFLVSNREENMIKFGFSKEETARIIVRIKALADRYQVSTDPVGNLIKKRMDGVDDQDTLQTALCTGQAEIRPWFTSMRFLVIKSNDGSLKTLEYDQVGSVEPQEWFASAPIDGVAKASELAEEPKPDAIKMAVAAILSNNIQKLLENEAPFGSGLLGTGWSWETVKKQNKGISERTMEWAAMLHLTEEVAFSEGGVCYEETASP